MQREGSCLEGCAACCKFLVLQVNPAYHEQEDVRRWVELHGIRLEMRSGACWAYIPLPCSALQGTKCGIYETRPDVCRTWPQSQADIIELERHVGQKVCGYSFAAGGEQREEE